MRPRSRVRCLAAALFVAAAASFAVRAAADEKVVNIVFSGKADPESVAPGGKGTLVLTGAIRATAHVYSNPAQFKVKPVAVPGVTYGSMTTSPTTDWKDPEFPEAPVEKVWMNEVVVRIPFTVAEDAKGPVKVGVNLAWSACDDSQCYGEEKQAVLVEIYRGSDVGEPPLAVNGGANGGAPSVPGMMPAPGDPAPPTKPSNTVALAPGVAATGTVTFHPDVVEVELVPKEGFKLYRIGYVGETANGIEIEGKPAEGIAWNAPVPPTSEDEITEAYVVRISYVRGTDDIPARVTVKWQGCDKTKCQPPEIFSAVHDARGARLDELTVVPEPHVAMGERGLLFPVVEHVVGTSTAEVSREESDIERYWRTWGIFFFIPIFAFGLLLAFTPCVLPIIPITVSIIGGGRTDLPKGRLTFLLSCYALGLSSTYGVMGLLAATGGASLSSAFESDVAIYVIAGVFLLLSLGMFGIYELQAPAWLQRIQGGAKGGNPLGAAAFGAMAAVIASPCVGPFIVGMLVFAASSGNALLSFFMFFTLGLGMSSVFFAAGSLNLLMRPGPWMVWIRWFFGLLLVGVAFYYLASAGLLEPPLLYVVGAVVAVGIAFGTWHHLAKKEMDDQAVGKSAILAAVLAATVGVVAFWTRAGDMEWTDVRDRAHLVALVEQAKKEGKVTVVDVWATWCTYCRKYDHVIEGDPDLTAAFKNMNRVRIRVDKDVREDLRSGIGIPLKGQPIIAFLDAQGRVHREHDILEWLKGPADELRKRVKALGVPTTK